MFYSIGREILYARCWIIHIYFILHIYVKTAKICSNYFYVQFSKKTPYHVKRLWSCSFWGPQWPELLNFIQKLWDPLPRSDNFEMCFWRLHFPQKNKRKQVEVLWIWILFLGFRRKKTAHILGKISKISTVVGEDNEY